jgi:hypothetical protein
MLHSCIFRSLNRVTWLGIICDFRTSLRKFINLAVNRFTRPTLPTINRKHFFMTIRSIQSFRLQKDQQTARSPFWLPKLSSEPAHARMLPNSHEARLYCYLAIHIENLLFSLQLSYFHSWPVYWLRLVTWLRRYNIFCIRGQENKQQSQFTLRHILTLYANFILYYQLVYGFNFYRTLTLGKLCNTHRKTSASIRKLRTEDLWPLIFTKYYQYYPITHRQI